MGSEQNEDWCSFLVRYSTSLCAIAPSCLPSALPRRDAQTSREEDHTSLHALPFCLEPMFPQLRRARRGSKARACGRGIGPPYLPGDMSLRTSTALSVDKSTKGGSPVGANVGTGGKTPSEACASDLSNSSQGGSQECSLWR